MHAEEAEVVASAEAGDDEALLGFGGGGFFDDGVDEVERLGIGAGAGAATDGTEEREERFAGGLDGGDGGGFAFVGVDEGLDEGPGWVVGHVEVVADEVEEGGVADEVAGFVESLDVAGGFVLFDERDVLQMFEEAGVAFGDDDGQPVDQGLTAFWHEEVHGKLGNGFELCVGLG